MTNNKFPEEIYISGNYLGPDGAVQMVQCSYWGYYTISPMEMNQKYIKAPEWIPIEKCLLDYGEKSWFLRNDGYIFLDDFNHDEHIATNEYTHFMRLYVPGADMPQ